jgi:hypothetical protein
MDIGPEQAPFIAEPLEDPFRRGQEPEPDPLPAAPAPVEPVPAAS